jgi:hypothetical protein
VGTEANGSSIPKRKLKKGLHNPARLIPPQIGVPKFCQLAAALQFVGRRRGQKDGAASVVESQSHSLPSNYVMEVDPTIVVQAGSPLPASGINLLINNDGESVPESISENEDTTAQKNEEANILIGIKRRLGSLLKLGKRRYKANWLN